MTIRNALFSAAVGCVVAVAPLLPPTPAGATSYDDRPKLLVHLMSVTTKNECAWGSLADCNQAVTAGQLATPGGPFYFAYILVATGALRGAGLGGNDLGVAGTQFGIRYDETPAGGLHVFSWHLCGTLEFASNDWPASGTGNLITWDRINDCQRGEVAVAGYFYCGAYTADELEIIPRPVDGVAKVADCDAREIPLSSELELGCAMFTDFNQSGCNPCSIPCFVTPVRATSWTSIKTLVR